MKLEFFAVLWYNVANYEGWVYMSMFEKGRDVVIFDQSFSYDLFQYLLENFKEAFSHSSLSVEEAFQELKYYNSIIEESMDELSMELFQCLGSCEKHEITKVLHQIIVFKGSRFGVFNEPMGDQKQIEKIYKKYFSYFEPYLHYYIKYDEEGNFDRVATFHNLDTLFYNLPQRERAYDVAYDMQRDNLDAFDYAMGLPDIGIREVIEINNIVNQSDVDKVLGFKKTNNDIIGASFTPVDKKNVPFEMQKLFAEYKEGFGLDLKDPNEFGISTKEKYRRVCDLFRREAIFHIRFERIHPFNDGNGRTGRILMNYHLLKLGLAPVLITNVMAEDYRQFIDDYDVEGFTKMLLTSSSQQITNWVSTKINHPSIRKNNINMKNSKMALAEMSGYKEKRKDRVYQNFFLM